MSWLDGSPKHQTIRSKDVPGSSAKGALGTFSTRTYGSNKRPSSSLRISSVSRGLYGRPAGAPGLLSMGEEEIKSPNESSTLKLSPGFDSSPKELAFSTNRGLDLDLGSPGDSPAASSSKGFGRDKGAKAKKPAARTRKGTGRARPGGSSKTTTSTAVTTVAAAARGSSAADHHSAAKGEEKVAPKRRVAAAAAAGRKPRAARGAVDATTTSSAGDGGDDDADADATANQHQQQQQQQQLSPTVRRERSPGRRGAGRPEHWGGDRAGTVIAKNPSPSVQSPLRPITNYTSEGDRAQRGKAKNGGFSRAASASAAETSSSNNTGNSSSGEEEWQDHHLDFSTKPKSKAAGRVGANKVVDSRRRTEDAARGPTGNTRDRARGSGAHVDRVSSDSDEEGVDGRDGGGGMDALEESEGEKEAERMETPTASSPQADPYVSLTLDSSVEGILVGDKRRRGGKRDARAVEDSAHRSSRSRHLSPLIPVSGGFGTQAFNLEEEAGSDLDDAVIDLTLPSGVEAGTASSPAAETEQAGSDLDDAVVDLSSPTAVEADAALGLVEAEDEDESLPDPQPTRPAAPAISAPSVGPGALHHRRAASATGFRSNPSASALSMTRSPTLRSQRRRRRSSLGVTQAEEVATAAKSQAADEDELAAWDDSTPPARLSRSLSLSQASSSWSSGAACAKVTRSSLRRRSRANSTSSPLPMLETSTFLPTGGVAETGPGGSWSTRSFGSGGFPRHDFRMRHGSASGVECLQSQSSVELSQAKYASMPLLRSHRMPLGFGHGGATDERPTSLPSGLSLGAPGDGNPTEASSTGDPGVGWVLRAPGALFGRHRSQSFVSSSNTGHLKSLSRSDFTAGVAMSVSAGPLAGLASDEDEEGGGGGGMAEMMDQEEPGTTRERSAGSEGGGGGTSASGAETPPTSPSQETSSAMNRAHGMSSVARRMDRLEIRSPDVETGAAQAQQEILGSPPGNSLREESPLIATAAVADSLASPVRPRPISLPIHLTPVGNWSSTYDRSRLSGAGGSPTECLRDYLSGQQRRGERDADGLVLGDDDDGNGNGNNKNNNSQSRHAAATPLITTPAAAPSSSSPPGITCTRSTALGLPSPIVAGLFGGGNNDHDEHDDDEDGYTAKGNIADDGSDGHVDRRGGEKIGKLREGVAGSIGAAAAGGGVVGGRTIALGSPPPPRKGSKLGLGPRARTVPIRASDLAKADTKKDSPEGGFLIRRKSSGPSPSLSSTTWPKAFKEDDDDAEASAAPPSLPRLSSGSGSSSLYLSCLSSGAEVESPVQQKEAGVVRRSRSISSPLPLTGNEFDTPSAFLTMGSVQAAGVRDNYDRGAPGNTPSDGRGTGVTNVPESAESAAISGRRQTHMSPANDLLNATTAAGASDCASARRSSTESAGAPSSSRAQFETPQAETKYKWGSRPQYGDWGISQPASAGSLRRLAGRLMAYAEIATGGLLTGGGEDADLGLEHAASPGVHAAATPLRSTAPLDDLQQRPGTTPGSGASSRGGASFGFRNSLGTLSERGEGHDAVVTDGAEDEEDGARVVKEEEGLDGGVGVSAAGTVWNAAAVAERVNPRDSAAENNEHRSGRPRLSSLLVTEEQRNAQRRRQSKAKMRRVSMSIKSRRSSSFGISSHLAGLSLLEMAEAASPGGVGKGGHRKERSPVRKAPEFAGGAISEGEEEDEEDADEPRVLQASPIRNTLGRWAASPMSVERGSWGGNQARHRSQDEGRGETPLKLREDLEKSLTDLNNLSLSICNSESDGSPAKPSPEFIMSPDSDAAAESPSSLGGTACQAAPSAPVGTLEGLRRHAAMVQALCLLSAEELLGEAPLVCSAWRKASVLAFAEVASEINQEGEEPGAGASRGGGSGRELRWLPDSGKGGKGAAAAAAASAISSRSVWPLRKLVTMFPWGGFLSEGGSKQVFKVWNAAHSRMEALSVMNTKVIAEEGDAATISQEIRTSILASSLVQRGVCPNFVQTFGLFRSGSPPPPNVFGTADEKYPRGRSPGIIRTQPRGIAPQERLRRCKRDADSANLHYQYIGMELCEYGDAELMMKAQPDTLLPAREAACCLFQMAFALYSGRAELSLRHFDVKLLNFFVGDGVRLLEEDRARKGEVPGEGGVTLRYGLGQEVVELRLPQERAFVVKLADFGTADVDPLTVGTAVEAGHFTTLENTPMEQLCCGSDARQGYASDTFALALATVHLFTGDSPYEEIMAEVKCPADLRSTLANTWEAYPQYQLFLDDAFDDDDHANLMDTFYRYLVLFGVPERSALEEAFGEDNPIWKAVGSLIGWKPARGRGGARGRRPTGVLAASKRFCRAFEDDRAEYSLERGANEYVTRARERLEGIPGAVELVGRMASFAPDARPTMLEVMRSAVFDPFKVGAGVQGGNGCLEFMAFARGEGDKPLLNL